MVETQATNARAIDAASDRVRDHVKPEVEAPVEVDASVQLVLAEQQPGQAGPITSPPTGGGGPPRAGSGRAARRPGIAAMLRSRDVAALQRTAGNAAVTGLVRRSSGRATIQRQPVATAGPPAAGSPDAAGRPPRPNPRVADAIRKWQMQPAAPDGDGASAGPGAAGSATGVAGGRNAAVGSEASGASSATGPSASTGGTGGSSPTGTGAPPAAAAPLQPAERLSRVGDTIVTTPVPPVASAADTATGAAAGAAIEPGGPAAGAEPAAPAPLEPAERLSRVGDTIVTTPAPAATPGAAGPASTGAVAAATDAAAAGVIELDAPAAGVEPGNQPTTGGVQPPVAAPLQPAERLTRVGDSIVTTPVPPVTPVAAATNAATAGASAGVTDRQAPAAGEQPAAGAMPAGAQAPAAPPQPAERLTRVGDTIVTAPLPPAIPGGVGADAATDAAAAGARGRDAATPTGAVGQDVAPPGGPGPDTAPAAPQPGNVVQVPEVVITGTPPPRTGTMGVPGAVALPTDASGGEQHRGFPEKRTPPPAPKPKAAPGGKGHARGGGGGGPKPVPPEHPPLHDPTLEKWRAASGGAITANKPGDLGDAKDAPAKVEAKGQDIDAARKAGAVDDKADAKSKQLPMPAEPEKAQQLDTKAADAAVELVKTAGDKHLTNQTFTAIDFGSIPEAEGVTGRDFVSAEDRKALADKENDLATKTLTPVEKLALTKDIERRKKAIADIEGKPIPAGPAAQPPITVEDKGPAKLTPPSAEEASLLGDAVARMLGQVDDRAKLIGDRVEATMHAQKVQRFQTEFAPERALIHDELDKELRGIATSAGVTEEQLKVKIAEQKDAVAKEADAVKAKLDASSVDATGKVEKRSTEEQKSIAGVKAGQDKEIADKQHAVEGPPDTAAIEKKRDEYLGRVTDMGAQSHAGLRASAAKRETELDSGANQQKALIRSASDNRAAAIRRHWADDKDPNMGMIKARATVDWGRSQTAAVDVELRAMKAAAKAESDRFTEGVNTQVTASKDNVRDWAAHQQGTERSWWDRLFDMIRDWGKQAGANNEAWEKQRNAESRDAMTQDFNVLTQLREAQAKGNGEAVNAQFARLSDDQKRLASKYFSGGISGIEFVAQSTMGRIADRRVPEVVKKLEEHAIAAWEWNDLGELARGSNPSFNPKALAAKVRGAVAGWGTKEDEVYAALGGARTAVERAAMAKVYLKEYGVSMEADIKDDMGGHEMERAKALMEGKSSEANAAAIKEAVAGLGTDEAAVRNALRGKTKEELAEIKAEYKRMYHVELTADLADDMEDAELDNALALADGDVDKADAAELSDAMDGPGTDEDKLKKVYERIREEEESKAKAEGLTPGELKQRIQDRNAKVKGLFNAKYGNLDVRMKDELTDWDWKASYGLKGLSGVAKPVDDADLKIVEALQSGDVAQIDAAKAAKEHQSVYTSDDEIEAAVRNQRKQAELDVALDLAAQKARIDALSRSGDLTEDQKKDQLAKWEDATKNKETTIVAKAKDNLGKLSNAYGDATNHGQTFDELVQNETSGESKNELNELITAGGKLSDEQELYYAIEGIGTDEDKIKEVLKGKTPAEIEIIRKAYAAKHPGRTLDGDLLGDLSGREDLDVGHTLQYGDPDTFAKQLEEAKTPEERKKLIAGMKKMLDDRQRFEQTGTIGQIFALGADPMNSADQLKEAVDQAEKYQVALDAFTAAHPGATPEDLAKAMANDVGLTSAKANFDMNYGGALEVQEQVRQQIDAYADVAVQVGAAVTALAVTIATAGAAGPVMAALYGAIAGAVTTMALKAQLRGAAYSWEEAGVDLAVGSVDAAMSAATAGLSKAIAAAEKQALLLAAKAAAKNGTEQVTESAVKAWIKEAMKEAVMNAAQGMPSAFVGAVLDDNTWKSGDPWGHIMSSTGQAAAMGGGMGVAMKGAHDIGGAAWGKIKGAAKAEPRIETHAPGTPEPHANAGEAHTGHTEPHAAGPEPKPVELPPEARPEVVADKAAHGDLPPEGHGKDLTKGGTIPEGMGPEPKADAGSGRGSPAEGRGTAGTPEAGKPHLPGEADVITELPGTSVAQLSGAEATDPIANREFFEKWHAEDPSREVALLRNEATGEFVLVQGDRAGVTLGGKENPNWAKELLSPEQLGKGEWVYEAHSHPTEGPKGVTPDAERWPSGGGDGGDFKGVAKEAARTGKPVSEEIHYFTENGREKLTYGYDPSNPDKPYFIERPGPDGKPVRHEYKTINEYHQDFEAKFGHEPGKPVADDFMGAREPLDHEAPTKRPGRLEDEGIGRGTTGDDVKTGTTKPEPGELGGTRSKEPEPNSVADAPQEAKKPGGPSPDDVGKTLTPQDLATRYGMPPENVGKIEAVCKQLGVIVDVRPTTPHAEVMLREKTRAPQARGPQGQDDQRDRPAHRPGQAGAPGQGRLLRPRRHGAAPPTGLRQPSQGDPETDRRPHQAADGGVQRLPEVDEGARGPRPDPDRTGRHGDQHGLDQVGRRASVHGRPRHLRHPGQGRHEAHAGAVPAGAHGPDGRRCRGHARRGHRVGRRQPGLIQQRGGAEVVRQDGRVPLAGGQGAARPPGRRRTEGSLARARTAAGGRSRPRAGPARERIGRPARRRQGVRRGRCEVRRRRRGRSQAKREVRPVDEVAGADGQDGQRVPGGDRGHARSRGRPAGSQRPSRSARDGHGQLPGRARRAAAGPAHGRWPGEVRACPRGGARSRAGGAQGRRDDRRTPDHDTGVTRARRGDGLDGPGRPESPGHKRRPGEGPDGPDEGPRGDRTGGRGAAVLRSDVRLDPARARRDAAQHPAGGRP